MKRSLSTSILFLFFIMFSISSWSQPIEKTKAMIQNERIGRGVNLGNALEAPDIGAWGVTLKEEYFELIAEKGFNSVRVPIRWNAHASANYPYGIDASFYQKVDWVIENSFKNGLYVIINFHHYEELYANPDSEKERFLKLWEHVCNRYKDYSDSLIFEILNEPHGNLTPVKWNSLLSETYNMIRQLQPERTLVIGTANYGGVGGLSSLQLPAVDDNIILTIHYYNPFHFTHQGAGWVSGSDAWLGTGWGNSLKERQTVKDEIQAVVNFAEKHNIPVYMGEFGAYSKAPYQSRVRWTNFLARYFEELGFSWAYWEFCSGFGVYNDSQKNWNEGLLYALLHMPMPRPANDSLPSDTMNLVTNPGFSDSTNHWYLYTAQHCEAAFKVENGEGVVSVLTPSTTPNSVSLVNSELQIENQRAYRISLDAYADSVRTIDVSVMQGLDPWIWEPYSYIRTFGLTETKTNYSFYFTMNGPTDHNARLRIDAGNALANLYIDNVSVEDLSIVNDTSKNRICFTINDSETGSPIENAVVELLGNELITSAAGKVEFDNIPVGYHKVSISGKHYDSKENEIIAMYIDSTYQILLDKILYKDTLRFIEKQTGKSISGVIVYLDGQSETTNLNGEAVFEIPHGTYEVSAEQVGYEGINNLVHTVSSDSTTVFELVKTHAKVKFRITSDNRPLNDVRVGLGQDTIETNNLGIVEFKNVLLSLNYSYSLNKFGYEPYEGSLKLLDDTTVNIELSKNLVNLRFYIFNDEEPVQHALVIINNDTVKTNSNGLAGFYDYPINQTYNYHIESDGYRSALGEVFAENDTTLQLNLVVASIHFPKNNNIRLFPNPVKNQFFVQSSEMAQSYVIYSHQGKAIMAKEVSGNWAIKQDVSELQNGNYIMKMVFKDGSDKIIRFIKM